MTYELTNLLGLNAEDSEASGRFPIREMFYDPDSMTVRYVVLDIGGWFDRQEVLVAIERFDVPQDRVWPVSMTKDEISGAPEWEGAPEARSFLPPLIVGPFGTTFSPLLTEAQFRDEVDADGVSDEAPEEKPGRQALIFGMRRVTSWIGREAFDEEGSLGNVEDLDLDETFRLIRIRTGSGNRRELSGLQRIAPQGHAIFG